MTWKGGQQAVRNRMLQIFVARQRCLVKELTRHLPKEEGKKEKRVKDPL